MSNANDLKEELNRIVNEHYQATEIIRFKFLSWSSGKIACGLCLEATELAIGVL